MRISDWSSDVCSSDLSVYGQFFVQRALDANSSLEGDVFANWYNPGFAGAENIFSTGAVGTYNRYFGRLGAIASLGVYTFDTKSTDADVTGQASSAERREGKSGPVRVNLGGSGRPK